ncbi:isocitrate lyase/phosphoenolpyruvate mutase family protein [Ancylobacter sonchi]|uniref:isocitrate lyase/PEP mutase family protein n=1 Tax=Ancylobacter sonchi TaxID=1937790 RepID=UPI001BD51799|nr:isocitrate lyase/phosphoenolpyruvate mutase family protein [Ancylobacter sonchi]MBS7535062.1 isocitrate lyase/phosphoenolpyruvate mutase family protein [Ancylobacter sonchi]
MPSRAAAFRALHDGPGAFILANAWDAGTARLFAALGFAALATTSAGMALARGVADGQTSREDVLAHCALLVDATSLPVSADLENGFGDTPEEVARTIRLAAATGLAGGSIEDHTNRPADPIYDLGLAVERIAAAVEARDALGDDFVLTARAENFLWDRPDLDDTIRRLQAYAAAGADVLYAPGLPDLAAVRAVCAAVPKPVNAVIGIGAARFTVADLAEAGVRRISLGSSLARLAYGGVVRAAREMRETGRFGFLDTAISSAELDALLAGPPQQE